MNACTCNYDGDLVLFHESNCAFLLSLPQPTDPDFIAKIQALYPPVTPAPWDEEDSK